MVCKSGDHWLHLRVIARDSGETREGKEKAQRKAVWWEQWLHSQSRLSCLTVGAVVLVSWSERAFATSWFQVLGLL